MLLFFLNFFSKKIKLYPKNFEWPGPQWHDTTPTASMAEPLTRVPRVWEADSSSTWPAKSYTSLQTVSCVAMALCHWNVHRKLVTRFDV